jgi:hypothetical protein
MSLVIYFIFAFAFLAALTGMIVQISRQIAECPETGTAARASGVVIATGYAAIGAGFVLLVGSALPVVKGGTPAVLFAIGFAAVVLGLGFTNAVMTLRRAVQAARPRPAIGGSAIGVSEAGSLVDRAKGAVPVAAEAI